MFTLTVKPKVSTGRYFQRHFTLKPGYNRIEFAAADIRAAVDLDDRVLAQIEPVETLSDNAFIFTVLEFVAFTASHKASTVALAPPAQSTETAAPKPAAKVKCVVWDLDNTLWRGTLIEDGFENLILNAGRGQRRSRSSTSAEFFIRSRPRTIPMMRSMRSSVSA